MFFKVSSATLMLILALVCGTVSLQVQENIDLLNVDFTQNYNKMIVNSENIEDTKQISRENAQEIQVNDQEESFLFQNQGNSQKIRTQNQLRSNSITKNMRSLEEDPSQHPNDNNNQHGPNPNPDNGQQNNEHGPNPNPGNSCNPTRCQTCQNSTTCTQCKLDSNGKSMYLLLNGRCHELDNDTNEQNQVGQKEKWQDHGKFNEEGHSSYGGRKFRCSPGCKVCNGSANLTQCSTCIDGFTLNSSTFTCMKCDDKCVTCDQSNTENCTSCFPGWTLTSTDSLFTCAQCSDTHCGQCSTVDSCIGCKNFYYLANDTSCSECIGNCRHCNDSTSCQSCFSGYFLNVDENLTQSCVLCASGCASCSNLTNCLKCYPGYFMDTTTQSCHSCSENCWQCSSSQNCTRCILGTNLVNDTCVRMIEDCAEMNTDNTCLSCYEGYVLSDSMDQCVENKTQQSGDGQALVCGQNSYMKNNTCVACTASIENCQKCFSSSCRKCKPQFFISNNGSSCSSCSIAIKGCKMCDNSVFCSRCLDGYYMEQDRNESSIISYGNCIKCDVNCLTCNQKEIYCTSCVKGYSLTTSRTCVPGNQFNFTLLLNLDLTDFPSKIDQFKSDLTKLIQAESVTDDQKEKFVLITKISSGSVKIEGTMTTTSSAALQNTLANFNAALSTGSSFGGIQVLSSKTNQNTNNQPSDQNFSNSSSSNVGMIVGIVVGVICAVIVVVAVSVYCCCCNKNGQVQEVNLDEKRSRQTEDEFAISQSDQKINSKSKPSNGPQQPAGVPQYFN